MPNIDSIQSRRHFLQTGVLGLTGLSLAGCIDSSPKKVTPIKPSIFEVLNFKRNPSNGKSYLTINPDKQRNKEVFEANNFTDSDIATLQLWVEKFNYYALSEIPQVEISLESIPEPAEEIVYNDVSLYNHVLPFMDPVKSSKDAQINGTDFVISTSASNFESRHLMPIGLDLSNDYILEPNSIKRVKVKDPENSDKVVPAIAFDILLNDGQPPKKSTAIIRESSIPIVIDSGVRFYIIGLDKAGNIPLQAL